MKKGAGYAGVNSRKKEKAKKREKRRGALISKEVSAEPMSYDIRPNKQSLSYHLACCVIYMLSAEDVDLTVYNNLTIRFVGIVKYVDIVDSFQ